MKHYRYYSTQRPVSLGTYPRRENVVDIHNYDQRTLLDNGIRAWGYIDYNSPLTPAEMSDYELVEPKVTRYAYDIGWTEAQEMNAEGWRITVKGYRPDGCLEWIHILPYTEELAFNETVREFTKSHDNITFNAKGTGGCK